MAIKIPLSLFPMAVVDRVTSFFGVTSMKEGEIISISLTSSQEKEFENKLILELHKQLIQEQNKRVRNAIIEQALALQAANRQVDLRHSLDQLESDALEDPLGISEPWSGKP